MKQMLVAVIALTLVCGAISAVEEDLLGDGKIGKTITKEGTGAIPPKGATVRAHYTGTLENGDEFDSSRKRNSPFSFPLGQGRVIKCWDEAFARMKVGETAVIKCASDVAYGARGAPPRIPGGATLFFDVELLGFDPPKEL